MKEICLLMLQDTTSEGRYSKEWEFTVVVVQPQGDYTLSEKPPKNLKEQFPVTWCELGRPAPMNLLLCSVVATLKNMGDVEQKILVLSEFGRRLLASG